MKFRVVLSEQGKEIYSGRNKEIMNQMLFSFTAKDLNHAKAVMYARLIERLGSGSEYLFKVEQVK